MAGNCEALTSKEPAIFVFMRICFTGAFYCKKIPWHDIAFVHIIISWFQKSIDKAKIACYPNRVRR